MCGGGSRKAIEAEFFDFRRYIRRRGSSRLGCLASKEAANLDVKF